MATQDGVSVKDSATSNNVPMDCIDVASAGSNPASGHSARQVVTLGDGGASLQYASVSSGGSLQINQACQISRTLVYIGTTGTTESVTETEQLITCAITKGLVAQTAANTYTVTSGKILRVQNISWQVGIARNTTTEAILRLRIGGTTTGTIVAQQGFLYGTTTSTLPINEQDLSLFEGYEFASGTVISFTITATESAAGGGTQTADVALIGYEYTPQ